MKTHLVRDLGDEYTMCGIPCTRLGRSYELRRVVRGSGEAYDCKFCIRYGDGYVAWPRRGRDLKKNDVIL